MLADKEGVFCSMEKRKRVGRLRSGGKGEGETHIGEGEGRVQVYKYHLRVRFGNIMRWERIGGMSFSFSYMLQSHCCTLCRP